MNKKGLTDLFVISRFECTYYRGFKIRKKRAILGIIAVKKKMFQIFTGHYSTFVIKKSIFSDVVLKHTISKRNKLLSWHKNLTRITSLITNVRNFHRNMFSQSSYFLHFSFTVSTSLRDAAQVGAAFN